MNILQKERRSQKGGPVPGADGSTDGSTDRSTVGTSRRDLAVARVLDPARARAETRVQRFLDAALELMKNGNDFTVQEVVERSGQSLRSFYQYFDGKYELLLALFEDSIRAAVAHLEEVLDGERDPLDRLHAFCVEYYSMCRPVAKGRAGKKPPAAALAEFAQQLLTDHPKEAARAFVPLRTMLVGLLDDAAAAGEIRTDLDREHIAGVVLQALMFNVFAAIISGSTGADSANAAEEVWGLLLHGIQAS
jgi:AcrR family transcriptional regulator